MIERSISTFAVAVELSKHKIPHLNITVTVTAYFTVGSAAAFVLTSVEIYLRAGTAGARTMFPKVILFTKPYHMRGVNTSVLCPDLESLFIIFIDRNIELFFGHFENLCKELPSPCCCVLFEVVAERKVSEHFKVCAVTCGNADTLNVGSSYALLASSNSLAGRCYLAREVFFHRCHTRVDKQEACVVLRGNKRKALQAQVTL